MEKQREEVGRGKKLMRRLFALGRTWIMDQNMANLIDLVMRTKWRVRDEILGDLTLR